MSSGAVLGMLQSCQTQQAQHSGWTPLFLSNEEAVIVNIIAEVIIPRTHIPGALDVAIPQFIDLLLNDVFPETYSNKFRKGLNLFASQFKDQNNSEFHHESAKVQHLFVEQLYQLSESDTKEILNLVAQNEAPIENKHRYYLYSLLVNLRALTISSYLTSELVGEKILNYDPIPGEFNGCVSLEDVGTVWSL